MWFQVPSDDVGWKEGLTWEITAELGVPYGCQMRGGRRVLVSYLGHHKCHCCEGPGKEQICCQQDATKELVIAERNG